MADVHHRKRKSLRNSVLKRGARDRSFVFEEDDREERSTNRGLIFDGLKPFFHDSDANSFHPFGFGGAIPFGDDFSKMMEKFFSDFSPESFADSRFRHEDHDLDDDISQQGLDRALEKRQHPLLGDLRTFSGGFSHSEMVITRPDGSVERKVTRKDADGNTETTTTITKPDGTTEVIEDDTGRPTRTKVRDHKDIDLDWSHDSLEYKDPMSRIFDRVKKWFMDE